MSLYVMCWVLQHSPTTLGERLVLIALAEFAHDDGAKAFPSIESLMQRAALSRRGVQEALRRLEEKGHVVCTGTVKSGTRVYAVVMGGAVDDAGGRSSRHVGAQLTTSRGAVAAPNPSLTVKDPSVKKKESVLPAADEPIGFSEWVAHHAERSGRSVPRGGTKYRSELSRSFSLLVVEGAEAEDFRLATDGVLGDDWMVANGHTKFETVLRRDKFWARVDDGRAGRSKLDAGAKYAHLDDDC